MSQERQIGSRIGMIAIAVILLAGAVYLIGTSLQQNAQSVDLSSRQGNGSPSLSIETDPFASSTDLIEFVQSAENTASERDLDAYYALRAYDGAPPMVPHEVDPQSYGGNDCLQCHSTGDYVPKYEAHAPIVPHPELESCNSCHVPAVEDSLFAESDWVTVGAAEIGNAALLTSPPPIPHSLEFREDCMSCHAGPAAPAEIRFDHPEREQCVQCHVLNENNEEWER